MALFANAPSIYDDRKKKSKLPGDDQAVLGVARGVESANAKAISSQAPQPGGGDYTDENPLVTAHNRNRQYVAAHPTDMPENPTTVGQAIGKGVSALGNGVSNAFSGGMGAENSADRRNNPQETGVDTSPKNYRQEGNYRTPGIIVPSESIHNRWGNVIGSTQEEKLSSANPKFIPQKGNDEQSQPATPQQGVAMGVEPSSPAPQGSGASTPAAQTETTPNFDFSGKQTFTNDGGQMWKKDSQGNMVPYGQTNDVLTTDVQNPNGQARYLLQNPGVPGTNSVSNGTNIPQGVERMPLDARDREEGSTEKYRANGLDISFPQGTPQSEKDRDLAIFSQKPTAQGTRRVSYGPKEYTDYRNFKPEANDNGIPKGLGVDGGWGWNSRIKIYNAMKDRENEMNRAQLSAQGVARGNDIQEKQLASQNKKYDLDTAKAQSAQQYKEKQDLVNNQFKQKTLQLQQAEASGKSLNSEQQNFLKAGELFSKAQENGYDRSQDEWFAENPSIAKAAGLSGMNFTVLKEGEAPTRSGFYTYKGKKFSYDATTNTATQYGN